MKSKADSIENQIASCQQALDALNRAVRGRNWPQLAKRNRQLNSEMDQLRLSIGSSSNFDESLVSQLQHLNLQFRRTQRQLSSQMNAHESDVESLEKGMRKVAMIREALDE